MRKFREFIKVITVAALFVVVAIPAQAEDAAPASFGTFRQFTTAPDNARGMYQMFYFTFEHYNSVDDIKKMKILFGANKDDNTGVYIEVFREGRVRLGINGRTAFSVDDGNLGDNKVIQTNKVLVDLQRSRMTQIGSTTLVVQLFLDFRDKNFSGNKRIFLAGTDIQDVDSELLQRGGFRIAEVESQFTPQWISMSPRNEEGREQLFSFVVEDRDGAEDITNIFIRYAKRRNDFYGNLKFSINPSTKEIHMYGAGQDATGILGQNRRLGSHTAILLLGESSIDIDRLGDRYVVKLKLKFRNSDVGEKSFWGNATDYSGRTSGEQRLGKYMVAYSKVAPHPMFMLPGKSNTPGRPIGGGAVPQTFSFWWRDSDGLDDIKNLQVKFAANSGEEDKRVQVDYRFDQARMVKNSRRFYGTVAYGLGHTVESDYAVLFGRGSSYQKIDKYTARIDLEIAFTDEFAGKWNVYLRGEDYSGNQKGWRRLGRVEVTTSSSRPDGRRILPFFTTGLSESYLFEFRDPDGPNDIDWAEVEFRQNGGSETYLDGFIIRFTQYDGTLRLFHGGRLFSGKIGQRKWIGENGVRIDLRRCYAVHYKDRLQLFVHIEFDNALFWGLKDILLWARDLADRESRRRPFGGINIPVDR